ncbi:GNAT family N-acetyltransferase [bacterium]|nr:GNAT family N-acetyltransferase [candidate division CSSED10-310 bacterium]
MSIIETHRLCLRELTLNDLDGLYAILSDPETMRYYPAVYNREQVQLWIKRSMDSYTINHFGLWAVELRETGEFIGQCGISLQNINGSIVPEIGYHIRKDKWRMGYASEAATACVCFGFKELNLPEIFIHTAVENSPSIGVAEKIGMKKLFEYDKKLKNFPITMKHVVYSLQRQDHINRLD